MNSRLIRTFSIYTLICISTIISASEDNCEIKIKFENLKNTECYLGYHFGVNKYVRDTATINDNGICVFRGSKENFPGGVYIVVLPNHEYFELIVNECNIYVETDTIDFIDNLKVIVSEENKVFYDYLRFMKDFEISMDNLYKKRKEYQKENNLALLNKINLKINQLLEDRTIYKDSIFKAYPDFFIIKIIKTTDEPEPRKKFKTESDSSYGRYVYEFYQFHYFDNVDFSDQRLLRTPLIENKIDKYIDKLTYKHPDSIKYAAERIVEKSKADKITFKFTLIKLFNRFATSKLMGQDVIFVHLAEKYYFTGQAYWADSIEIAQIYKRVSNIKPNIIGKKSKNIVMKSIDSGFIALHELRSQYTVIVFWDQECSHCVSVMPKLRDLYKNYSKNELEVYSVYIGLEVEAWKEYVKENNMTDWVNVSDPNNYSNFRLFYDINNTPIIYLLNNEKIIVAKRIQVDHLKEMLANFIKK